MIVLEGPDGMGKTTLGLALSDALRFGFYRRRVQHCMMSETRRTFEFCDSNVVDRFYLTDRVYSHVHGRAPGLSRTDLYKVCLMAERSIWMHVFMYPHGVQEEKNLEQRLRDEYCKVHQGGRWYSPSRASCMSYRPKPDLQEAIDTIIKEARIHRATIDQASAAADNTWITGGSKPEIVLWIDNKSEVGSHRMWVDDIIADMLFACRLRPHQVAILWSKEESSVEKFVDHTKAKLVIRRSSIPLYDNQWSRARARTVLVDQQFQAIVDKTRAGLEKEGIETSDMEEASECR